MLHCDSQFFGEYGVKTSLVGMNAASVTVNFSIFGEYGVKTSLVGMNAAS